MPAQDEVLGIGLKVKTKPRRGGPNDRGRAAPLGLFALVGPSIPRLRLGLT
jgi:hypothetical protein